MSYAIKCTVDNKLEVVDFDESKSYETIKEAIGGGIFQCIYLPSTKVDMWIDDEGKLANDAQINAFGCALWVDSYGMTDMIVGDIIITGSPDDDGKTLGLTQEQVVSVLKAANDVMILATQEAFKEDDVATVVE